MASVNRRRLLAFGAIALAATAGAGAAIAEDAVPDAVAALDAAIHTVVAGGYWTDGTREGAFRAIVTEGGVEHVRQQLYLQWLVTDIDSGTSEVAATVSVDEINQARAEGQILNLERDADAEFGTLRLNVRATGVQSDQMLRYVVTASGAAGQYVVQRVN